MKHQYFGDANDYVKYGLLRCFAEPGFRVGICWMLTPEDQKPEREEPSICLSQKNGVITTPISTVFCLASYRELMADIFAISERLMVSDTIRQQAAFDHWSLT